MLTTFANSLVPVQDQQSFGPDQDPNCLTLGLPRLHVNGTVCVFAINIYKIGQLFTQTLARDQRCGL